MLCIVAEHSNKVLVYDPEDVEGYGTPRDVIDKEPSSGGTFVRELGRAHLVLHFKEGKRPRWVAKEEVLT